MFITESTITSEAVTLILFIVTLILFIEIVLNVHHSNTSDTCFFGDEYFLVDYSFVNSIVLFYTLLQDEKKIKIEYDENVTVPWNRCLLEKRIGSNDRNWKFSSNSVCKSDCRPQMVAWKVKRKEQNSFSSFLKCIGNYNIK